MLIVDICKLIFLSFLEISNDNSLYDRLAGQLFSINLLENTMLRGGVTLSH